MGRAGQGARWRARPSGNRGDRHWWTSTSRSFQRLCSRWDRVRRRGSATRPARKPSCRRRRPWRKHWKSPPSDGLVKCACVSDIPGPAEELALHRWTRIIDNHLTITLIGCKIAGAMMRAAGRRSSVKPAPALSFSAGPDAACGAARAGIVCLTASLGARWCGRGTRVDAVSPGWNESSFLRPPERGGERDSAPIVAATPAGRLLRVEEIAEVVAFLLSPAFTCIAGATISRDGGIRAACGWSPYGGIPSTGTGIQPCAIHALESGSSARASWKGP